MKEVKFIKRHVSGIEVDEVKKVKDDHAKRLEKEGYVKIIGTVEDKDEDDDELIGGNNKNKNKNR